MFNSLTLEMVFWGYFLSQRDERGNNFFYLSFCMYKGKSNLEVKFDTKTI